MEKYWGLDLDMSAVRLLCREGNHWAEASVEKIDSPDIEARLQAMLAQIEDGAKVELFLPNDQILCTEIELPPVGDTRAEIERAMDGRTPYSIDELVLDWELIASGRAIVAAIAHETLDEAAAFAEVRGLGVSGYSSLGLGDDFPRLPRFDGPHVPSATVAVSEAPTPPEDSAVFTTARRPSRPPSTSPETTPSVALRSQATDTPAPASELAAPVEANIPERPVREPTLILKSDPAASIEVPDGPVVHVEDDTPVMSVKSPQQPLNPGAPVASPSAPPRVRTDIAASTVSGSAASLTPPGSSVKVRQTGSIGTTAMIFAAVFLLTVGIATLVWMLLPLSPGRNELQQLPSSAQSGQNDSTPAHNQIASLPEPEISEPANEADAAPEDVAATPIEPETAPQDIDQPETALEQTESLGADVVETAVKETVPNVPDLPQPRILSDLAPIEAPVVSQQPSVVPLADPTLPKDAPELTAALALDVDQPTYDPAPPLPTAPRIFQNIQVLAPFAGPTPETTDDIYIASIESSELASDAIALPSAFGLKADALPGIETGLSETPRAISPETDPVEDIGVLAPEGDNPVVTQNPLDGDEAMAAAVAEALADALAGPGGLVPTKLATSVPDLSPRPRPGGFVESIERDQFGGRSRQELETLRPPARPKSVQSTAATPSAPPSELAVSTSLDPQGRPQNFAALVAAARVQREAERLQAAVNTSTPDTSSAIQAALSDTPEQQPRQAQRLSIPSSASVARAATIENAIPLNKVNLVGVYGSVSDRRALVRLPSGRYVKVKVGDRVDGGTVAQITDSELLYRKGNRTLSLAMPQG